MINDPPDASISGPAHKLFSQRHIVSNISGDVKVAVGTTVARRPRADLSEQNYRTGLLSPIPATNSLPAFAGRGVEVDYPPTLFIYTF
jgi:hypothetical protein